MDNPNPPPPPETLLPTPFGAGQLWAIALQTEEEINEGLVLADEGQAGLHALQKAYPPSAPHALAMAFALPSLLRLQAHLRENEAEQGVLDASVMELSRSWPTWWPDHSHSFFALGLDPLTQKPVSTWVQGLSRGEAALAFQRVMPGHSLVSVGDLEGFEKHIKRLDEVVALQDYGALWCDLRTEVPRPASRAHITAYPLAALGHYPTAQQAMAAHQALFLEYHPEAHEP